MRTHSLSPTSGNATPSRMLTRQNICSVSYTHLDVYKRQTLEGRDHVLRHHSLIGRSDAHLIYHVSPLLSDLSLIHI